MTALPNTIVLINFLPSVNSTYSRRGAVYPSNAVILIGSVLKKNGFDVKIIDGGLYSDYLQILSDFLHRNLKDVVYVGMSVMTTQVPMALKASKFLNEKFGQLPVVWGGPHCTLFPEQTLFDGNIDIVSINEGSRAAVDIAETLRGDQELSAIPGIGYRDDSGRIRITEGGLFDEIDEMPHFDFSLIDIDNYLNPKRSSYENEFSRSRAKIKPVPILTGLGCPYKCQFCINVILKRRYRFRGAESIVSEIKRLRSEYDADTFIFMDEDFFISKKRTLEFLDRVEAENLRFNWRMWCRVDHFGDHYIDEEMIRRLDSIGHGSLVMGGESGDQTILDSIEKGTTTEQIVNSLKALAGTNINPRYSFIVGFENETLPQIRKTYDLCLKMLEIKRDVDIAGPFLLRLYPGSPIYNRLVAQYHIVTPEDLESWECFLMKNESQYSDMPWTPTIFQNHLVHIPFYSQHAMKISGKSKGITRILRYVLTKLSRYRIRKFFFRYPFEYWIAKYLLKAI